MRRLHPNPMRGASRRERGSILVVAVVVVAVLSTLAAAAISFSSTEYSAARVYTSGDELVSCADAGRQYLLSKFKMLGPPPTNLQLSARLDTADSTACSNTASPPSGGRCARGGHIGQRDVTVKGVRVIPSSSVADSRRNARDLTNVITTPNSLGGQYYQLVVHCEDDRGRETEVEFALRFGL